MNSQPAHMHKKVIIFESASNKFLLSTPPILFACRTDKDASTWSKDKLKSLLVGVTVEGREGEGGWWGDVTVGITVIVRGCGVCETV